MWQNLDLFISCVDLAMRRGKVETSLLPSVHAFYTDLLDCDLQIYYRNSMLRGLGQIEQELRVYLGGRVVFDCCDREEKSLNGINLLMGHGQK